MTLYFEGIHIPYIILEHRDKVYFNFNGVETMRLGEYASYDFYGVLR